MKYAIIQSGSKQYKVKEKDEVNIEKIEVDKGKKVIFENVLLVVNGDKRQVGQPNVKKASVLGEVLDQVRGKKIRVATYKAKSKYRRVKGHRQQLTKIKIKKISTNTSSK